MSEPIMVEDASLKALIRQYGKLLDVSISSATGVAAIRARVKHDLEALLEHGRETRRKCPGLLQVELDLGKV